MPVGRARAYARKPRRPWIGAVLLAALALGAGPGVGARADAAAASRANVVLVMTDDQNAADMSAMERTRALLGDQGATFTNSFVNNPLCCPSRSTFLTGQYSHNHGVVTGGGYQFLDAANILPVWLQGAGYHTGHVGKYVNGYGRPNVGGPTHVPTGWDEWYAAVPNDQAVYGYQLNENGTLVAYGASPGDFKGDVLTMKAAEFISRNAPSPAPFFLSVHYTAPHSTHPLEGDSFAGCDNAARPAPRHLDAFSNASMPRVPSFGEADVSDKPAKIAALPPLGSGGAAAADRQYRCRLASLLHVDDGVEAIVTMLAAYGELDDTLVIFTSDNGMLLGEHRIPGSKIHPYEESIRVPLLMRGPGVPAGAVIAAPAVNADLAPTITQEAGATPGLPTDGLSLFELIANPARTRDIVVENFIDDVTHSPYAALRTPRYLFASHATAELELYDLERDPFELQNRAGDRGYAAVLAWMTERLAQLRACSGSTCSAAAGTPPDPIDVERPRTKIRRHPKPVMHPAKRRARAKFKFVANEPATFRCRLDRRPWRSCRSARTYRVAKGRHVFRVRAIDMAGNRDRMPARWRWRVKPRGR